MKRKLIVLAALLAVPCVAFAANRIYQIPTNCGDCEAGTPLPDPGTAQLLDAFGVPSSPYYQKTGVTYAPGDTVTICNAIGCATYTISNNNVYTNGQWVNGASHKPGGGGGGGSGAGGGGIAGGGSGIGDPTPPDGDGCPGCNPTVTVGAG